ncbi:hypothetical protein GYB22_04725 [bacterium]|nr:hypothetical protein [bacterium]
MSIDLERTFIGACYNFTQDSKVIDELWRDLQKSYSDKDRHYHTLDHIKALCELFMEYRQIPHKHNLLLLSVFYHDVVYQPLKKENEFQSAKFAEKVMKRMNMNAPQIRTVVQQILATADHKKTAESDTNFLIDLDLSILGAQPKVYEEYRHNIRKEYHQVPQFIFNRGRRKVLNGFLKKSRIYIHKPIYERFEEQARKNIKTELELIS